MAVELGLEKKLKMKELVSLYFGEFAFALTLILS